MVDEIVRRTMMHGIVRLFLKVRLKNNLLGFKKQTKNTTACYAYWGLYSTTEEMILQKKIKRISQYDRWKVCEKSYFNNWNLHVFCK